MAGIVSKEAEELIRAGVFEVGHIEGLIRITHGGGADGKFRVYVDLVSEKTGRALVQIGNREMSPGDDILVQGVKASLPYTLTKKDKH